MIFKHYQRLLKNQRIILSIFVCFSGLFSINLSANGLKSVKIMSVDADFFPDVKAVLSVLDSFDIPIPNLLEDDFEVEEESISAFFNLSSIFQEGALVDMVVVFDTTTSMKEEITDLKDKIETFTDALSAISVDFTLGLVVFGDDFHVYNEGNLTSQVETFQEWLAEIIVGTGGMEAENPFDALAAAATMSFRENSQKLCLLITDAPAHYRNDLSPEHSCEWLLPEIVDHLNQNSVVCHVVGPDEPEYSGAGSLSEGTGGSYFSITSDFAAILDKITTILSGQYIIHFNTPTMRADGTTRNIEIAVTHEIISVTDTAHYVAPDKTVGLFYESNKNALLVNETVQLILNIGENSHPAKGLYGLALVVDYESVFVEFIDHNPGNFFNGDPLSMIQHEPGSGKVYLSVTKMDGLGCSGTGSYWQLDFRVKSIQNASELTHFSMSEIVAFDSAWVRIPILPDSLDLTITSVSDSLIVWPGDTDNNGFVNQADVLPIGIFFSEEGPTRPNASIDWIGQECPVWSPDARATYVDATGDGVINGDDIFVVGINFYNRQIVAAHPLLANNDFMDGFHVRSTIENESNQYKMTLYAEDFQNLFGISLEIGDLDKILNVISIEYGDFFTRDILFFHHIENDVLSLAASLMGKQKGLSGQGELFKILFETPEETFLEVLPIIRITGLNDQGEWVHFTTTSVNQSEEINSKPKHFRLHQNYPNPFNPSTIIQYELPIQTNVLLQIIDISGRVVCDLKNTIEESGFYQIAWDGKDNRRRYVSGGIYLIKLKTEYHENSIKCLLVR
ncbi:VWA domain-containing protein [candidate division KSB1 bacterium]|nr:VWA domain-containing protein [candidate division KSB1 bacterium]